MREIEFRGMNEAVGMVHGYYVFEPKIIERTIYKHWIVRNDGFKHPVDPETVGQFSGLGDFNNNKIFEGDFLKDDENYIWEVKFKSGSFFIRCDDLMASQDLHPANWAFEVVGNIHEHELKGGEIFERGK